MLVGAEPDRPSASYKLNTLVSNTLDTPLRERPESLEEALPSTRPSLLSLQGGCEVVGRICALEPHKPRFKSWPCCFTHCMPLAKHLSQHPHLKNGCKAPLTHQR